MNNHYNKLLIPIKKKPIALTNDILRLFKISDLEKVNCPKNRLNSTLKALKINWARNNFELSHDEFLVEVKNILK